MAKQLYWEEVETGSDITPLAKIASRQMLAKWAGASGDFNPLHYDDTFAASQGVGKPIVHGQLKRAWLMQMVTDWISDKGRVKTFSCQFKGIDYPRLMKSITEPQDGETWWCKGKVTNKFSKDGEYCLDCDIWVENGKGDKTTEGKATVSLPSKTSTR